MAAIDADPRDDRAVSTSAPRGGTLREQIARLERELAAIVSAALPAARPRPAAARAAGPRLLVARRARARPRRARRARRSRCARAAQRSARRARAARAMLRRAARHKWLRRDRGARRARLHACARPPAARPGRHADGLVARQDLLRLPVSRRRPMLMGRRSRKRGGAAAPAPAAAPTRRGRPRRAPEGAVAPVPARRAVRAHRASCCSSSGCLERRPRPRPRAARLRHGARLARRPRHRAARALRRLPLAHDAARGAARRRRWRPSCSSPARRGSRSPVARSSRLRRRAGAARRAFRRRER